MDFNKSASALIEEYYKFSGDIKSPRSHILSYEAHSGDFTIVGSTSLDGVIVILQSNGEGLVRFLWRNLDAEIDDALFDETYVRGVLYQAHNEISCH